MASEQTNVSATLQGGAAILVTGATGKVGGAAVRALRKRGIAVRALVHDSAKAAPLAEIGAELAVGDFTEPSSLDAALRGIRVVILVSPAIPAQELSVVEAAVRAGATHIIKATSKASADSPIARRRGQAEIEAGIIATGLDYTFLRSNAYMQNLLMLAPAIAKTDSFGSAAGDGRIGMVDARDVGEVAAVIAAVPERHVRATYQLSGPELITYEQIAAQLSSLLGRPISFRATSFEDDKQAMIRAGLPEAIAAMNAQAQSLTAEGDAAWLSDDVAKLLGVPPRSVSQFLRDYEAAFS